MSINILAVILSAIASIILGSLWHGPLFGKKWMALMKFTPEQIAEGKKKNMTKSYVIEFISSLVIAIVFSNLVSLIGVMTIGGMVQIAIWVWFGFVATIMMSSVLWEGKSFPLYAISAGYRLVQLVVIAIIVGLFM